MIWGETGTRYGATSRQISSVAWLWAKYGITRLHDGDCVGVDDQLWHLARSMRADVSIHPPTNPKFRAWCGLKDLGTTILPAKGYFIRDRDIVNDCEVMAGVPHQNIEPDRSWEKGHGGTWYTINYARDAKRPLALVWPNGHITYERWDLEPI